jgi:hypothetical protein
MTEVPTDFLTKAGLGLGDKLTNRNGGQSRVGPKHHETPSSYRPDLTIHLILRI